MTTAFADLGPETAHTTTRQAAARRQTTAELAIEGSNEGGTSAIRTIRQRAPLRIFRPAVQRGEPATAVIANMSGGVVTGDRLSIAASARPGAALRLCGQAAEKVYRAPDATSEARIETALQAQDGAWLELLPQGTIVFDGARLRRRTVLDVDDDATTLAGELLTLGRAARGESFDHGLLHDEWRVRRDGRLVWADVFRLEGIGLRTRSSNVAALGEANVVATMLLTMPGAERLVPDARAYAASVACELRWGVTAFGGLLIARLIGDAGSAIREVFGRIWCWLRARAGGWPAELPAIWNC